MGNKLTKGVNVRLDIETHRKIEHVRIAEGDKFNLPVLRRKETICEDLIALGLRVFIKVHELDVKI